MELLSSDDDFVLLSLLEKRRRKYWVHSILKTRQEQGKFHLLIKKLQNSVLLNLATFQTLLVT